MILFLASLAFSAQELLPEGLLLASCEFSVMIPAEVLLVQAIPTPEETVVRFFQ